MRVVLETTHLAPIGGAENYLMNLAMVLDDLTEFYVVHNWPERFNEYVGFYRKFKRYSGTFEPEVYLHCSHFVRGYPIGKRNYSVVLFPKPELAPTGYDGAIPICDFTDRWTKKLWGVKNTYVIEPCVHEELFAEAQKTPKEKKIVSIGHFFEEDDGHSKNQHILAEAFDLSQDGFKLVLIGSSGQRDTEYIGKVRKASRGKAIDIKVNADHATIKAELSTSSFLWHANGYGRSNPAQTEHFGIIAIEALASGVQPIVHASGGCSEIPGVLSWERPEDLNRLTRHYQGVPRLNRRFTADAFRARVEGFLKTL